MDIHRGWVRSVSSPHILQLVHDSVKEREWNCLLLHARMADRDSMLTSHHGFGTTTPVDQRPWLWTIGLLSLIYSALALCARITSKWGLLWYDDAILASSYVSHSCYVND